MCQKWFVFHVGSFGHYTATQPHCRLVGAGLRCKSQPSAYATNTIRMWINLKTFITFCLFFTGTTWVCQIVSLLLAGEEKYDEVKKIPLTQRCPFLEQQIPGEHKSYVDMLENFPTPRVDKTHLPYRFIKRWIAEDRVKTIITSRNPKDTLVSMFHFYQSLEGKQ